MPALGAFVVAALLASLLRAAPAGAADAPVNLLRLLSAHIESTSLPADSTVTLNPMFDGDPATALSVTLNRSEPLDVMFGFGGEVVAPAALRVILPDRNSAEAGADRIELLVSTVSPYAGFHSVRSDPLDPAKHEQRFSFAPTAARWITVRLVPKPGETRVGAAEIEVLGAPGAPASHYAFKETPARAIDLIARLHDAGGVALSVTADEQQAFAQAHAGPLDPAGFANLALLASGVTDAPRRAAYVRRLDQLAQQAGAALAAAATPADKAQALLGWLHKGPMAKGYRTEQTDLSVLLDSGEFNCVSSATIYNILALRLGLDVRAVEVPDHAYSVFYQGTNHMDVETTTAAGFNPSRDPVAVARFEHQTGFHYIPDAHRDQRREIDDVGLAAIIYYNHGVMLSHQKRYDEALAAYFRAMSLDPEFASAVKNALAVLANWSVALSQDRNWPAALKVVQTGLALAPDDPSLRHNHAAVWTQWASSEIDAGHPDAAINIFKRAAAAIPNGGFAELQAWVYIKPGEQLLGQKNWDAAFALATAGMAKLDPVPAGDLERWRNDIYLRWFGAEMYNDRFEAAAGVLARGLAALPGNSRLTQDTGYLAQQWARGAAARDGYRAGLAALRTVKQQFGALPAVSDAVLGFVQRTTRAAAEAGRLDEAMAALDDSAELIGKPDDVRRLGVDAFDRAARVQQRSGAWAAAADIYAKALARYPAESLLVNNIGFLAQEWQRSAYASGGAASVATVQHSLSDTFPTVPAIRTSGREQIRRAAAKEVDAGNYAEALHIVEQAKPVLSPEEAASLADFAYDSRARRHMAAREWSAAADSYADGLAQNTTSDLLRNNTVFLAQQWSKAVFASDGAAPAIAVIKTMMAKFPTIPKFPPVATSLLVGAARQRIAAHDWPAAVGLLEVDAGVLSPGDRRELGEFVYDQWARGFIDSKDWAGAMRVYDAGLQRFPDDPLFTRNRRYCEQQKP
jgi:tetratricopeptide (TPR) repeat protein